MSTSAAPQTAEKPATKAPTGTRKTAAKKAASVTVKRAPQAASKKAASPAKAPTKTASTLVKPVVKKAQAVKAKPVKEKKVKVVRDSFTIPKTEFMQIADMKKRAMTLGVEVKKSELIRAGLQLISGLQDAAFKKALAGIPTLKTGRPAKD